MFKSRVALAATLSTNYGIYNGFELWSTRRFPGKEEYLNSEKYEIKVARLGRARKHQRLYCAAQRIRRANPALAADSLI